jgi:hypothetical protein
MCRARLLAILVLGCAVAVGIRAHASRGTARSAPAVAPAKTAEKKTAWTAVAWGVGENAAEAEEVALQSAAGKVHEYLVSRDPSVQWTPPSDYVRAHLLEGAPRQESIQPDEARPGLKYKVEVRLEVPDREYQQLLARDREYRKERQQQALTHLRQQRLVLVGKIFAGLLAVCIALAVYLRLDEATKGIYTRWLRLAAVGFVGAIAAGLWLLPFVRERLAE